MLDAYLVKRKLTRQQQLAYVEEAHRREQPPLEAIAAPEILRGELNLSEIAVCVLGF